MFLSNFEIFVGNKPDDDENECIEVDTTVKKPISTDKTQYECFKCQENAIGSFVTIQMEDSNKPLIICDINIQGNLVKEQGFY